MTVRLLKLSNYSVTACLNVCCNWCLLLVVLHCESQWTYQSHFQTLHINNEKNMLVLNLQQSTWQWGWSWPPNQCRLHVAHVHWAWWRGQSACHWRDRCRPHYCCVIAQHLKYNIPFTNNKRWHRLVKCSEYKHEVRICKNIQYIVKFLTWSISIPGMAGDR